VIELDDRDRRHRLATAVQAAGWLQLRDDAGDGAPLASGVEAAIIAEALSQSGADAPFVGPIHAADLARRAGVRAVDGAVVAFAPDLIRPAVVTDATTDGPLLAVDHAAHGRVAAYVLGPEDGGYRLALAESEGASDGADLTRTIRAVPTGTRVSRVASQSRRLGPDDLDAWTALGLALTSADIVGLMRGVLDVTVTYAKDRKQYGVAIGTFQAVQHLLAEARCLIEGALSAALYPAWAVDQLAPGEARAAGRVAKAYCARASRTVCETAVQVHGGIGNTWDCIVHVYLRRALLSSRWFGDDSEQLRELARVRLGVSHGLS
jgi:alkylation response protein AidB-like acyl-CoA dehydrogenase